MEEIKKVVMEEGKKCEMLVALDERYYQKGKNYSFPLHISPRSDIARTRDNEREYRHVTALIIPILSESGNRLLIIDKRAKERAKNPLSNNGDTPIWDVLGGHLSACKIPLKELKAGLLTYDQALEQAFRELTEELRIRSNKIPPFKLEDLIFLGFAPYESTENKELSLVFGILLKGQPWQYEAYDDVANPDGSKRDVMLRIEIFDCEQLMEISKDTSGEIADGLGRLIPMLPEYLRKMGVSTPDVAPTRGSDADLINLLNRDSALGFSYVEKLVMWRLAKTDMSYREIAAELEMINSPVTVNSMRQRLELQATKADAILALNVYISHNRPKRAYKKNGYREQMPVLDGDGRITTFVSKSELHNATNPKYHPTVITLLWKRNTEGEWSVLMADKANNWAVAAQRLDQVIQLLDFVGSGHVEIMDLTSDPDMLADLLKGKPAGAIRQFTGMQLSEEVYRRTALREFQEEVKLRSTNFTPSFVELCEIPYDDPTLLPIGGWNREISKVYLVVLPQSINDIRVHERYEDSTGEVVKSEHVANFMTIEELESLYEESADNFLDGAGRVLAAFRNETSLKAKMFMLLEQEEKRLNQTGKRKK